MGKLRSRDGCLTCRRRHVKCDEVKPVCGKCSRTGRNCLRDDRPGSLTIKNYRPRQNRLQFSIEKPDELDGTRQTPIARPNWQQDHSLSLPLLNRSPLSREHLHSPGSTSTAQVQGPAFSPIAVTSPSGVGLDTFANVVSPPSRDSHEPLHQCITDDSPSSVPGDAALSHREAFLLHHFTEHLARWLDCTDASQQFKVNVTTLAKSSPILRHAVISYAARHVADVHTADLAQEKCIRLLIPLLSSVASADSEAILCAIVILRVCEQLSVTEKDRDQERHLAGFSALLKTSQGRQVDPSIPTISQAAFWVYVRQCLYNACVNQQPPNLDFDVVMLPPPPSDGLVVDVKTETAWANTMIWISATIMHFCFGASLMIPDPLKRKREWEALSKSLESWNRSKPRTFEPIWFSAPAPGNSSPFPEIWFTADWHVMAFGFYQLACMLLAIYKPSPRFAVRSIRRVPPETDNIVMAHARSLCGACKSSPSTVPSLITLCHSTFIWAPLMTDGLERQCVIEMLQDLEKSHSWPTTWIIKALQEEWMA